MSKKGKLGLGLLLGAAAGYAASLFISEKTRDKHKATLEAKFNQVKEFINDPKEQERLKELFEEKTKGAAKTYEAIRTQVAGKLEDASKTWQKIDKDKYTKVIEKSLDQLKSEHKLSVPQLAKLKKYLVSDFEAFVNSDLK